MMLLKNSKRIKATGVPSSLETHLTRPKTMNDIKIEIRENLGIMFEYKINKIVIAEALKVAAEQKKAEDKKRQTNIIPTFPTSTPYARKKDVFFTSTLSNLPSPIVAENEESTKRRKLNKKSSPLIENKLDDKTINISLPVQICDRSSKSPKKYSNKKPQQKSLSSKTLERSNKLGENTSNKCIEKDVQTEKTHISIQTETNHLSNKNIQTSPTRSGISQCVPSKLSETAGKILPRNLFPKNLIESKEREFNKLISEMAKTYDTEQPDLDYRRKIRSRKSKEPHYVSSSGNDGSFSSSNSSLIVRYKTQNRKISKDLSIPTMEEKSKRLEKTIKRIKGNSLKRTSTKNIQTTFTKSYCSGKSSIFRTASLRKSRQKTQCVVDHMSTSLPSSVCSSSKIDLYKSINNNSSRSPSWGLFEKGAPWRFSRNSELGHTKISGISSYWNNFTYKRNCKCGAELRSNVESIGRNSSRQSLTDEHPEKEKSHSLPTNNASNNNNKSKTIHNESEKLMDKNNENVENEEVLCTNCSKLNLNRVEEKQKEKCSENLTKSIELEDQHNLENLDVVGIVASLQTEDNEDDQMEELSLSDTQDVGSTNNEDPKLPVINGSEDVSRKEDHSKINGEKKRGRSNSPDDASLSKRKSEILNINEDQNEEKPAENASTMNNTKVNGSMRNSKLNAETNINIVNEVIPTEHSLSPLSEIIALENNDKQLISGNNKAELSIELVEISSRNVKTISKKKRGRPKKNTKSININVEHNEKENTKSSTAMQTSSVNNNTEMNSKLDEQITVNKMDHTEQISLPISENIASTSNAESSNSLNSRTDLSNLKKNSFGNSKITGKKKRGRPRLSTLREDLSQRNTELVNVNENHDDEEITRSPFAMPNNSDNYIENNTKIDAQTTVDKIDHTEQISLPISENIASTIINEDPTISLNSSFRNSNIIGKRKRGRPRLNEDLLSKRNRKINEDDDDKETTKNPSAIENIADQNASVILNNGSESTISLKVNSFKLPNASIKKKRRQTRIDGSLSSTYKKKAKIIINNSGAINAIFDALKDDTQNLSAIESITSIRDMTKDSTVNNNSTRHAKHAEIDLSNMITTNKDGFGVRRSQRTPRSSNLTPIITERNLGQLQKLFKCSTFAIQLLNKPVQKKKSNRISGKSREVSNVCSSLSLAPIVEEEPSNVIETITETDFEHGIINNSQENIVDFVPEGFVWSSEPSLISKEIKKLLDSFINSDSRSKFEICDGVSYSTINVNVGSKFKIHRIGYWNVFSNDMKRRAKGTNFMASTMVQGESCLVVIDNEIRLVRNGDSFMVKPGVFYQITNHTPNVCCLAYCLFDGN